MKLAVWQLKGSGVLLKQYYSITVMTWVRQSAYKTNICLTSEIQKRVEMFTWYLLTVQQSRLPFNITLESLEEFPILEEGRNHSYTGVKMVFRRNNLSLLAGGFYFPTLVFSLLSLLSFAIKPEVVSYCIIFFLRFYIHSGVLTSILGSWSTWFTDHTVFDCFKHICLSKRSNQ